MDSVSTLSAVVPIWDDYIDYLPACLAAVRAQTVDARIIIVDNASTRVLPPQGAEVTVVQAPRRLSAGAARNLGLAAAKTQYVAFVDADDVVLPGTWRFLLDRLERDAELVAAAAQLWWVDEATGSRRPASSPRPHVYRHLNGRRRLFSLYLAFRMALPTTTATIFRTAAVREAGGFGDANLAEDWALAATVALRGRIEQHERPGANVLLHRGSLFNRRFSRGEIAEGMGAVRRRLRSDPRTPPWLRVLLGPIGVVHALKAAASADRPALREAQAR